MFQTRLHELCCRRAWDLPCYTIRREGPDHDPCFQASVIVNDLAYHFHNLCNSSKEAQNHAAQVALMQLSSSAGSSNTTNVTSYAPARRISSIETKEASQTPELKGTAPVVEHDNGFTGLPHASRFRCKVTIDGQTFQSPEFFPTIKEAEHTAAKLALMSLSPNGVQEDNCVYKNLLQELAQKQAYLLPVYVTNSCDEGNIPTFVSSVEIDGEVFTGQEARTKKQAEFSAAKAAYTILKEGKLSQSSILHSPACKRQV